MPGDSEARVRFLRLFETHGEKVLLYFKRRTDPESARDGAADTFLVAWRRIDEIPKDKELPWLYGVARRVLSQQRRSSHRGQRLTQKLSGMTPPDVPAPDAVVVRNAEYAAVMDALERLRPRDREVLRLAVWEELPHADIGTILGCSAHAVDQRLYRATRKLARELRASGHKQDKTPLGALEQGEEAS